MKYAAFLILWSVPCFAGSGMQLDIWVYGSAQGHGLGPETYIAEIRLPTNNEKDCEHLGGIGVAYAKLGKLPDNSMALVASSCEPLP